MAKLYYRYGALGSSKTANAIMVQYNYHERGQKVLMLKPKLENRDGAVVVKSRCGLETECRYVEDTTLESVRGYDCVIVDEAQFLTKEQVKLLVAIVDELKGEKIDVIQYSEKTEEYIAAALAPAEAKSVEFDGERSATVHVNGDQLSLAIGKEGQNVRLAAKLTGCKIDIKGIKL